MTQESAGDSLSSTECLLDDASAMVLQQIFECAPRLLSLGTVTRPLYEILPSVLVKSSACKPLANASDKPAYSLQATSSQILVQTEAGLFQMSLQATSSQILVQTASNVASNKPSGPVVLFRLWV